MKAERNWTEADLTAAQQRMGRGGESKTRAAGERSASTPPGLRGNRNRAETTTRTLQNGPSPIRYRSKWEPLYAAKCDMEKRAGVILDYRYEPSTWYLEDPVPGRRRKRHTPDFWIQQLDGSLKIVAVKGFHKNIRESLTLIRWAAQRYPWFEWWVTWLRKGNWEEVRV